MVSYLLFSDVPTEWSTRCNQISMEWNVFRSRSLILVLGVSKPKEVLHRNAGTTSSGCSQVQFQPGATEVCCSYHHHLRKLWQRTPEESLTKLAFKRCYPTLNRTNFQFHCPWSCCCSSSIPCLFRNSSPEWPEDGRRDPMETNECYDHPGVWPLNGC